VNKQIIYTYEGNTRYPTRSQINFGYSVPIKPNQRLVVTVEPKESDNIVAPSPIDKWGIRFDVIDDESFIIQSNRIKRFGISEARDLIVWLKKYIRFKEWINRCGP